MNNNILKVIFLLYIDYRYKIVFMFSNIKLDITILKKLR